MGEMAKAIVVGAGGGFERVSTTQRPVPEPGFGEVTVRLRASSLNYHDFAVVSGMWGPPEERIPMSDGAGEVTAVGPGVADFAVGDHVVSTFFPTWLDGQPEVSASRPFRAMASMAMPARRSPLRRRPSPMPRPAGTMPRRRRSPPPA